MLSNDEDENEDFRSSILSLIPDGYFKNMVAEDLDKSELNYRSTIEKYFYEFAPLLFDYTHEFWRVFKETLSKLFKIGTQIILHSIDSLANHLIYEPTIHSSIFKSLNYNEETEKIFYQSPKTKRRLFGNSESITKYLEGQNMTRLEKQPKPVTIYCNEKDGRVYITVS